MHITKTNFAFIAQRKSRKACFWTSTCTMLFRCRDTYAGYIWGNKKKSHFSFAFSKKKTESKDEAVSFVSQYISKNNRTPLKR